MTRSSAVTATGRAHRYGSDIESKLANRPERERRERAPGPDPVGRDRGRQAADDTEGQYIFKGPGAVPDETPGYIFKGPGAVPTEEDTEGQYIFKGPGVAPDEAPGYIFRAGVRTSPGSISARRRPDRGRHRGSLRPRARALPRTRTPATSSRAPAPSRTRSRRTTSTATRDPNLGRRLRCLTDRRSPAAAERSGHCPAPLCCAARRDGTAHRIRAPDDPAALHRRRDRALFEAEAASIALYRADEPARVRHAAGAQGQGVVGLKIPADQGIAGYAFTTGEPIAIAEPERTRRFGKDLSAGTGYVPRSILAVPMRSETRTTGILEVLDKREGTFTMRDIQLASVFAQQAAVAIQVGARALDAQELLR